LTREPQVGDLETLGRFSDEVAKIIYCQFLLCEGHMSTIQSTFTNYVMSTFMCGI